jgi:phage terminase small subunit
MLNERQKTFAIEYVKQANATSAAISAGYSAKTAHQIGHQLLKHTGVAAEIARLTTRSEKKSALTAEKVVDALNNLVDFDPGQCFDEHGKLLPINKMSLEARKALSAIDMDKGNVKFTSRLGSLELAAKLLGMVREQQTQQQAVQIIIAQPSVQLEVKQDSAKLLPEWE